MLVRRFISTCLATLSLGLILALSSASSAPAQAAAQAVPPYVDGISDQSLPAWDGGFSSSYFAGLFHETWVGSPLSHITLARYVVQWNVIAGDYPRYLSEFRSWLTDISNLNLTPDVALTSYDGIYPSSSAEYQTSLEQILDQASNIGHPIRYLEAWNEPNNQGNESALNAANFTNSASATCGDGYGCTVIAGNLEDSPNAPIYEETYIQNLNPVPIIWGVHPYYSVEEMSEAPFLDFRGHLPDKGVGEQIWFTEISARECSDFDGHEVENGELGQAQRASWLVNTLMRNAKPEHVFYYEFLLGESRRPSCISEGWDGALYLPSGDPAEPDYPRLAASYIWGAASASRVYIDGAFMANTAQRTLTGGGGL
jgi:hypothetical protein